MNMKRKESLIVDEKDQSSLTSVTASTLCSEQIQPRRWNSIVDRKIDRCKEVDEKEHSSLASVTEITCKNSVQIKPRRRSSLIPRKFSTGMKLMRRSFSVKHDDEIQVRLKKSLRGVMGNDDDEVEIKENLTLFQLEKNSLNNDSLIVFNSDGSLNIKYKGSMMFLSIIMKHYRETYQFCESDTRQADVLKTILEETKRLGLIFMKIKNPEAREAIVLDEDDKVLQIIRDRINEVQSTYLLLF